MPMGKKKSIFKLYLCIALVILAYPVCFQKIVPPKVLLNFVNFIKCCKNSSD